MSVRLLSSPGLAPTHRPSCGASAVPAAVGTFFPQARTLKPGSPSPSFSLSSWSYVARLLNCTHPRHPHPNQPPPPHPPHPTTYAWICIEQRLLLRPHHDRKPPRTELTGATPWHAPRPAPAGELSSRSATRGVIDGHPLAVFRRRSCDISHSALFLLHAPRQRAEGVPSTLMRWEENGST